MSWATDAYAAIRKIVLLEDRMEALATRVVQCEQHEARQPQVLP